MMPINYMKIIGEYHPGTAASCNGDASNYSNIIWIDTAISQATLDSEYINCLKSEKNKEIDARTKELIDSGFSFDGETFSLSLPAQKNWLGIKVLKDLMSWPVDITTLNDGQYSLAETDIDLFIGTGQTAVQTHLDSGRTLKIQVNAATTEVEVNAVEDNR